MNAVLYVELGDRVWQELQWESATPETAVLRKLKDAEIIRKVKEIQQNRVIRFTTKRS